MKLHLAASLSIPAGAKVALAGASGLGAQVGWAKDAGGTPSVAEDTGTFPANAGKKARARQARLPADSWVLADDSGLCVDALDGAPGVESAYYAGPQGDAAANLRKLVEVMLPVPAEKRGAHFICILVLAGPGGADYVFEGKMPGRLLLAPRGGQGFGYDPLFVPEGSSLTFAEMSEAAKNAVSHRGRAWARLAEFLRLLVTPPRPGDSPSQ